MDLQQVIATLLPLAFIAYWVTTVVKNATNQNWNGLATQIATLLGSYVVVTLFAHSSLKLGDTNVVENLPWEGLLLVALAMAATAGAGADWLRARNPSDPTVAPTLFPSQAPMPVADPPDVVM